MLSTVAYTSLLAATPALAVNLWAAAYNDHTVTTLNYDPAAKSLTVVGKTLDCGSEPTWMTLDKAKSILYCLNEGWGGNASITAFSTAANGNLSTLDVLPVLKSPVSSILYGPNNTGLAVAHYDTSTFSSYSVSDAKKITLTENVTYTLSGPGIVPDRQDAPHLHEAILDPTKKFLLSPDLGSDLIRIFAIQGNTTQWAALTPVKAVPGSGPRHGVFATVGSATYFYTLNELGNSITGYSVSYNGTSLSLTQTFSFSSHGPNGTVPAGTKAAEIEISPDGKFILVSSRGEGSLWIPNFNSTNTTQIKSDPIITYSINPSSGSLTWVQTAPAGGMNPRGFNINKAGTLVASALQDDNRVVIIERDVATGMLGKIVAWATVGKGDGNGPPYVLWDE